MVTVPGGEFGNASGVCASYNKRLDGQIERWRVAKVRRQMSKPLPIYLFAMKCIDGADNDDGFGRLWPMDK
jgi:hypothetical protein